MSGGATPAGSSNVTKVSLFALFMWSIAALFFLYEFFLRTFLGTLSEQIIPSLHLTLQSFSLIGSAYYLTYALMQVPVGLIIDKFGVKITMIFASILCACSGIMFSMSQNFLMAFSARLLMGFGSSFAFICLLVIAMTWLPRKHFGFFSGISTLIGTMGPVIAGGPLVMILNKSHLPWQKLVFFIGMLGFFITVLSILFVRNKPKEEGAKQFQFLPKRSTLMKQLKSLLLSPTTWIIALCSACLYEPVDVMGAIWGTNFLEAKGFPQGSAASVISLLWIGYAVGCPFWGALSDRLKRRKSVLATAGLCGVTISLVIYFATFPTVSIYYFLFFLLGVTGGGSNVGFVIISESVSTDTQSAALGLNNGMGMMGGFFIPPIFGAMVNATLHSSKAPIHLTQENFHIALLLLPAMFLLSFLASLFIKETYGRSKKSVVYLTRPEQ